MNLTELWRGAVTRAIVAGHPGYDTLFIELAIRLGWPALSAEISHDRIDACRSSALMIWSRAFICQNTLQSCWEAFRNYLLRGFFLRGFFDARGGT